MHSKCVVQELARALRGSPVSEKFGNWPHFHFRIGLMVGLAEFRRGGPQLCKVHTSYQRMSEGPENRILVISASLDQARAAVKRMFFFLRCVILLPEQHG